VYRILHLIDTGGPGGAETVFVDLVRGLRPPRWEHVVVVPDQGWIYRALRNIGLDPVVLRGRHSFDQGYVRAIRELIRRDRITLLQAHLLGPSVYGSFAAALEGVPAVCTLHGEVDVDASDRYALARFRIISWGSSSVVFVSEALRLSFLARYRLGGWRTRVIENGVDTERFRPRPDDSVRRELGIAPGDILVGAVGNLRPAKRYDVFLRVAAELARRSPAYHFVVFGQSGGALDGGLLALRRELGLEKRVHFAGFVEDIERILPNLDVYLLSSDSEGFSLSTVQALAAGIPVVATRCGGPEDILEDGMSGLLADRGSVAEIVQAVERLRCEPGLGRRLAAEGRTQAERRFSVAAQVRHYDALYEEVLRSRRRAPLGSALGRVGRLFGL
jgi:glycosyltransferase involved in cell wall biosynthesis